MTNTNKLIKNILSIGLVQIANYLIPLISIPVIVRIIGPGNYGVINYYTSFVAYFILLINYGFDYSGTRFIAGKKDDIAKRNEHFTKILSAKAILFLVSSLIFSISILFISKSFDETKVALYTYLITISWVLSPNWFYQGMQQLTQVSLFNFFSKVLFTVMILLIIKQRADYIWQPLVLSLTQIFTALISLLYAIKKFKITFTKIKFRAVIQLLWEDRMIFFSMIALNLYTDTNVVILGFYESKENVGYFTAAWKLMFVFLAIISFPISQAMFPFIANSFSENIGKGIEQIKRILPIIIYTTGAISIALFVLGGIIILGFYGKHFQPSVLIFRILTVIPVLSFINSVLGLQTMVNLKMDKAFFRIILTGGLFSIIFNNIIIRFYGYMGCAISWIVTEVLITAILHFYLVRKGYNLFKGGYFAPHSVLKEIGALTAGLRKKNTV